MSIAPFSADDFQSWLDNPVTQWVRAGVQVFAEAQAANWLQRSWNDGDADQRTLDKLKTRADAYMGLANPTYEDACAWSGQEPQKEAA